MYACSPRWSEDWIEAEDLRKVLEQLAKSINEKYPPGFNRTGINYGLHFTGGEPFLNFEHLLQAVRMADELEIPATFVETNSFWCLNDEETFEKLSLLKNAGLDGMLVSVNPFILEYVPFERIERAVRIGRKVFNDNLMIYQEYFFYELKRLNIKGTIRFEEYIRSVNPHIIGSIELLPMGRVPYRLNYLYDKYLARTFFTESCREELTRDWHIHVDNYCNYIPGYCGGISLGDARNLDAICKEGLDLGKYPIIKALAVGLKSLYKLAVEKFGYEEAAEGYISKCHLCIDIRKHLVQFAEFKELRPIEFYGQLE